MLASALRTLRASSVPSEPLSPVIKTSVPGPKSLELLNELETVSQDFRTVRFFADYDKSVGNYITDADGNQLLDCFGHNSALVLGYNHPALVEVAKNSQSMLVQRPSLGMHPPANYVQMVKAGIMSVAPKGLTENFNTCGCGSSANENAIKAAFMKKRRDLGGKGFTPEEISSSLENKAPGTPSWSVLSFSNGFHGRLLGCLSCTHSIGQHKLDIPAFNWPFAPFPELKYPLERYPENKKIEEQSLDSVQKIFKNAKNPIAAIIMEPLQGEAGNYYASAEFYQGIRQIATDNGAALIIDEVHAGLGASGKMWCHQHYGITPDIMTFAKKMQVSGYVCRPEYRPDFGGSLGGTWIGDPLRLGVTVAIQQVVRNQGLVQQAADVGEYFLNNIEKLSERFPQVHNYRGKGLLLAFDLPDSVFAWKFLKGMLERGVHVGLTRENIIRIRTSLVFEKKHADVFLGAMEDTLKSLT